MTLLFRAVSPRNGAREVASLCVCVVMFAGCGGNSGTTPTAAVNPTPAIDSCSAAGPGCTTAEDSRSVGISVFANDNGAPISWTYTFAGLTVSRTGDNYTAFTGLTPGDYEVNGQMLARGNLGFNISVGRTALPSGIVPNSVQSLEGPVRQVLCSGVGYSIGIGGATPQNFRFKFTLSSANQTSCF